MTYTRLLLPVRRATPAALIAAIVCVASAPAASNTFTLTVSDANGSSSFTTWNVSGGGSSAPAVGTGGDTNDYFTGALVLRTPTSGDATFGGDSLTVQAGGQLALKGPVSSTVTVNNLILDGGQINVASGTSSGSPAFNLAGNISVNSTGGLLRAFSNGTSGSSSKQILNITAVISGSGPLSIDYNSNSSNSKGTVRLSAANTYTGELKVLNNPYTTALSLNHLDALKFATLTVENVGATGVGFNAGSGTYNVGALQGTVATGTIATASGIILSVGANNTGTSFAGIISGAGALSKVGTGTLSLSGTNTFSGGVSIDSGTLATSTTGTFGAGNVSLSAAGLVAGNNASFNDAATLSFSKTVSTISLSFAGVDTLASVFDSVTSTYLSAGTYDAAQLNAFFGTSAFSGTGSLAVTTSPVPEPSSFAALAGLAVLGSTTLRRRRRA